MNKYFVSFRLGMSKGQGQMMGGLKHSGMMGGPMMAGMMPGCPQMPIMPDQQLVNPGLNDAPLEFNTNKNKPPMPISGWSLIFINFTQLPKS